MKLPESLLILPTPDMTPDELEALQIHYCHLALQIDSGRREPLIKLAQIYLRRKEWVPANFYATAALELPWAGYYGSPKRFYENEPHEILHIAKGWLGDIQGARHHLLKCLEYEPENPYYLDAIPFYWGKPLISICIPTLGRPEKLQRLLEAIKKNAGYDKYEIIVEEDKPIPNNEGCPTVLKRAVAKSKGDLVMFLGNDVIPEKNFLKEAYYAMVKNFPNLDGMIGLNDGYWDGSKGHVATHWLASKSLLPALGGEFFDTEFFHTGVDNILQGRCEQMGKYAWAKNAKITHEHPINSNFQEGMDEIYEMAYVGERREKDNLLYQKKVKQFGIRKF